MVEIYLLYQKIEEAPRESRIGNFGNPNLLYIYKTEKMVKKKEKGILYTTVLFTYITECQCMSIYYNITLYPGH